MEKWELALIDRQTGMKYKDIAEKHGVSINTVKAWKTRKWNDQPKGASTEKGVHTKKEKVAHKKEIPKAVELLNDNEELNDQQKLFCLYYLQSFNATRSYQKAFGVAYDTANSHGYKMLSNVVIKAELERLKLELQSEQYFTIQDIINDYAKQWKADIKDYVTFGKREVEVTGMFGPIKDEEGNTLMKEVNYVDFKESDEVDGTLAKSVKMGKDGPVVELYDGQKAMAELVKLMPSAALRKLEAEAAIMQNKADKLTNDSQVDELLHALLNPMLAETSEVDADDTVQSEAD